VSDFTRRYPNRLFVSSVLALGMHAAAFLALQLVLHLNLFAKPEYPETVFVSLENTTELHNTASMNTTTQTDVKNKTDVIKSDRPKTDTTATSKDTKSASSKSVTAKSSTTSEKASEKTGGEKTSSIDGTEKAADSGVSEKPEPTARRSALDEGNLSGLDKAISSDTGTDSSASTKDTKTSKSSTGVTGSGKGSATGNIQWEDSSSRSAISAPPPKIPSWVEKQGLRLSATIKFVLGPDGYLSNIRVERSTGYTEVDIALTDALRSYKFEVRKNARNVSGSISFLIDYK
jgi:TonB family protein